MSRVSSRLAAGLLPMLALAALAAAPAAPARGIPTDPGRLHATDVDGDGLADVAVPDAATSADVLNGVAGVTVVFGGRDRGDAPTRGGTPSSRTTRIVLSGRRLGNPSVVGDVNGDGLADVAVGVAQRSGAETGAYVVLGSPSLRGTTIDLAAPPAGRVVALPRAAGAFSGGAPVLGLGDVNGDGTDDVGTGVQVRGLRGAVVVLGRRSWPAQVALNRLGSRGVTITGRGEVMTPWPLGDTDGDGRADVGFVTDDPARVYIDYAGSMAWVVRGRSGGAIVRLNPARRPQKVTVLARGRRAGWAFRPDAPCGCTLSELRQAGDVNGDGRADLLVPNSAQETSFTAQLDVVFGQRRSRAQVGLGAGRLGIRVPAPTSVGGASIGDLTGDGLSDVIAAGKDRTGLVVLAGTRSGAATPVLQPWVSTGARKVASSTPVGDVDGDGRGDLLVLLDGTTSAAIVYGQATLTPVDLAAAAGGATLIG